MESVTLRANNFEQARKLINQNKDKRIIFSGDDETNRKILEKEKIDVLLLPQSEKKDFHKQRNSGFNQVLAKLAKKKEVIIGIDFDEIIKSEGKERARIIARVMQNAGLCKKAKLKIEFICAEYKISKNDLISFGLTLGMPTWMIRF